MKESEYRKRLEQMHAEAADLATNILLANPPLHMAKDDEMRFLIHFEMVRQLAHSMLVQRYATFAHAALKFIFEECNALDAAVCEAGGARNFDFESFYRIKDHELFAERRYWLTS